VAPSFDVAVVNVTVVCQSVSLSVCLSGRWFDVAVVNVTVVSLSVCLSGRWFDVAVVNVTVVVGQTAVLPCSIEHLANFKVHFHAFT